MSSKLTILFLFALIFLSTRFVLSQNGWNQLQSGTSAALYSVNFPASGGGNAGYVVGGSGTILATTNAGVNWSIQSSPASYDLESVTFLNSLTGYASGSQGTVLFTSNGGVNWTILTTPSNQMLWSIYFINTLTGWSCGQLGLIFYTTNGGVNWSTEMSTTGEYLRSVYFSDAMNGICTGRNGKIIKTTNAGAGWFDVGPYQTSTLYTNNFINASTGWAAGFGTLKTTNAGSNWFLQQSSGIILGIFFSSNVNGWEVGADGALNYTTNAGSNWISQNFSFQTWLYGVYFTSLTTGYIVGDNGTILKTTNGGGLFTSVNQIGSNVPNKFSLIQNYPNPFNPSTTIKFDIPENAGNPIVMLIIYDALGGRLETIVNKQLQPGSYSVEWYASNYPSGIYFYKLTVEPSDRSERSDGYTQTKKMVLIK